MKWFKHETNDRNTVVSKLIRANFGAEGYGIYQTLLEVIAEYVEEGNLEEWGHVDSLHNLDSLAAECSVKPEKLKEFLKFCDERGIFQKDDGRLFSYLILKR